MERSMVSREARANATTSSSKWRGASQVTIACGKYTNILSAGEKTPPPRRRAEMEPVSVQPERAAWILTQGFIADCADCVSSVGHARVLYIGRLHWCVSILAHARRESSDEVDPCVVTLAHRVRPGMQLERQRGRSFDGHRW
jgi:hypothetical protein